MRTFKSIVAEVAEPLSQGERNFKALHNPVDHKNLVPGVTDQDHLFNGSPRREDVKSASYENFRDDDESLEAYDKGTQVKKITPEKDKDMKEEIEQVDEISRGMASRYISKADSDPKRKKGVDLARLKKWGDKKFGLPEPKVKATEETVLEKTLTPAEMKKREEIAKAMGKSNPAMSMGKKMAIATAMAKKVAEEVDLNEVIGDHVGLAKYADEHGRIDKEDLHTAAKHMKSGNMNALRKHLHDMDTDPRDKALEYVKKKHYEKLGYRSEEVEQVNELTGIKTSPLKKLGYVMKAGKRMTKTAPHEIANDPTTARKFTNTLKTLKKMNKEEVENLEEKHAMAHKTYADYVTYNKSKGHQVIPQKLWDNMKKAKVMKKEEVENLDELSKKTLGSYVNKAVANKGRNDRYSAGKPAGDKESDKIAAQRAAGIKMAVNKLAKEEVEGIDEAKRGRPSKNASADGEEGGREHIIVQLRKAENLRGSEKKVEFNDNSKHSLDPAHVKKALNMHAGMKPMEKGEFEKRLAASHASFTSAIKGEAAPKPKPKITLGSMKKESMDPTSMRSDRGPMGTTVRRGADGKLMVVKHKGHPKEVKIGEAMDPVNQEDPDINNDGKVNKSDAFLKARRKAISKAIAMKEAEELSTATVKREADTQYVKGQKSDENMQKDSLDKLKLDPAAGENINCEVPPTQGNKPIGGEDQTHDQMAEQVLYDLYNSLNESNKAKFDDLLKTEEGVDQLLSFAKRQGLI